MGKTIGKKLYAKIIGRADTVFEVLHIDKKSKIELVKF